MATLFTPEQIEAGRRTFHRFMSFNVIAFSILTGNVISVFAIKLDVSNTFIGLLQSFVHLSMVFILVGRVLMDRFASVRVFEVGWFLRYVFASLLLVIPLVTGMPNGTAVATALILIATGGFHVFRGIGVAGQVPVIAGLASGPDRGRFLSANSILANSIALAGGLAIAALLGPDAPLSLFVACFAVAIVCGFLSVIQIRRLPEPRVDTHGSFGSFIADVRSVASDPALGRFIAYLAAFALGSSALIAFLVVLAKRVFFLPDNFTVLLVAIGNLGAIASGLLNRRLVDSAGPKPLIVFFQALLVVVALVVALTTRATAGLAWLTGGVFFLALAAQSGLFVSGQSYYFSLYPEEKHRNLGMLYSLVNGSVGALGAFAGGRLLDTLETRMELADAFRVLFLIIAAIAALALVLSAFLSGGRRGPAARRVRRIALALRHAAMRLLGPLRRR